MQTELDILRLISEASLVVKLVMALLVFASVFSWAAIINRIGVVRSAKRKLINFENQFWRSEDLLSLYRRSNGEQDGPLAAIFVSGFREFIKLRETNGDMQPTVLDSIRRAMKVTASRETEKLERFLPMLATIGSISPYVGLFGTVWGIMTSFQVLGNVKQASLALVAPGISEALVATAMGLFAAIPAVVAYNRFSNDVYRLEAQFEEFSEEFSNIIHHQLPNQGLEKGSVKISDKSAFDE